MPLIEWIPEPKYGDREKREQDDLEYNSDPKVSLEKQKEQLRKELFGNFKQEEDPLANLEKKDDIIDPEDMVDPVLEVTEEDAQKEAYEIYSNNDSMENTWTEEEYMKEQEILKIKETKEFPLVKNYLEERNIVVENLSLNKDWKIDINNIDWLSIEDREALNWLLFNIEWENKWQNRINLSESIKDLAEFEKYNLEITDDWFEDWVLNKIWENYLQMPNKDWDIDVKKNVSLAIEMAKNQICLETKNFNRDSQSYKTAVLNIESWNLKKQLEWINSLYYLAYSKEWIIWNKELKNHIDKRKDEIKKEVADLTFEIKKKESLNIDNTDEIQKLKDIRSDFIKEAQEIDKWEIFKPTELDAISDTLSEWWEQV